MSLSTPGVFNVLDDWYMGTGWLRLNVGRC